MGTRSGESHRPDPSVSQVELHQRRKELVKLWLQTFEPQVSGDRLLRFIVCEVAPSVYDLDDTVAERLRCKWLEFFPALAFSTSFVGFCLTIGYLVSTTLMAYGLHVGNHNLLLGSSLALLLQSLLVRSQASFHLILLSFRRFDIQFMILNCITFCTLLVYNFEFRPISVAWSFSLFLLLVTITMTDSLPPNQRKFLINSTLWAAVVFLIFLAFEIFRFETIFHDNIGKDFYIFDRCLSAVFNMLWYFVVLVMRSLLGKKTLHNPSFPLTSRQIDPRVCHVLSKMTDAISKPECSGDVAIQGTPTKTKWTSSERKLRLIFSVHRPIQVLPKATISLVLFGPMVSQIFFNVLKRHSILLLIIWAVGLVCILAILTVNSLPSILRVFAFLGACLSLVPYFLYMMNYNMILIRWHFRCPESLYHSCNNLMLLLCLLTVSKDPLVAITTTVLGLSIISAGFQDCANPSRNHFKISVVGLLCNSLTYIGLFWLCILGKLNVDYEMKVSILRFEISPIRTMYSVLLNLIIYFTYFTASRLFKHNRLMSMESEVGTKRTTFKEAQVYTGFSIPEIESILRELDCEVNL